MADFYIKAFGGEITGDNGLVVTFRLFNQKFIALNGGAAFEPNPSVSFMVACSSGEEVEKYYNALKDGATELMPLDSYDFSKKYVWLQDKYKVNWQIMLSQEIREQKIIPSLMFVGPNNGKAREALEYYTSIFPDSSIVTISTYGDKAVDGQKPEDINYSLLNLDGYLLTIMESAFDHKFQFSEGLSIVVDTEDQEQTDYYWEQLTMDGGQESNCGWLKDKYGMNWQIVPKRYYELTDSNPDKQQAEQVNNRLLRMHKIIVSELEEASQQDFISIKANIKANVSRVWEFYTSPEAINRWNHASPDWDCKDAKVDLKVGGRYEATMFAKDGSNEFTFGGTYTAIEDLNYLEIKLDDGRLMQVVFTGAEKELTFVNINFNPESENPREMQKQGWQAILDNFREYCESNAM